MYRRQQSIGPIPIRICMELGVFHIAESREIPLHRASCAHPLHRTVYCLPPAHASRTSSEAHCLGYNRPLLLLQALSVQLTGPWGSASLYISRLQAFARLSKRAESRAFSSFALSQSQSHMPFRSSRKLCRSGSGLDYVPSKLTQAIPPSPARTAAASASISAVMLCFLLCPFPATAVAVVGVPEPV